MKSLRLKFHKTKARIRWKGLDPVTGEILVFFDGDSGDVSEPKAKELLETLPKNFKLVSAPSKPNKTKEAKVYQAKKK